MKIMKNKWAMVVAVVGILILAIAMIIVKVNVENGGLVIANFDQVKSSLASNNLRSVEDGILTKLKNERVGDGAKIKALVRVSSYDEEVVTGGTWYQFLVDIDAYKVTYRVSFVVNNTTRKNEDVTIACPSYKLMKYPDSDCAGGGGGVEKIERYLPYVFEMESGRIVTVTAEYAESGERYLKVRVSTCGDENVAKRAEEAVLEWIMSLGYDPANFKIVKEEFCDVS